MLIFFTESYSHYWWIYAIIKNMQWVWICVNALLLA